MTRCVIVLVALLAALSAAAQAPTDSSIAPDRTIPCPPPLGPESGRLRHAATVRDACWTPDGMTIVSVSGDSLVRLWDAGTGTLRAHLSSKSDALRCVAASAKRDRIAAGGTDGRVTVWRLPTGGRPIEFRDTEEEIRAVAWAPLGNLVAFGDAAGAIRIRSLSAPEEPARLVGSVAGPVRGLEFESGGNRLLSVSLTAKIWNLEDDAKSRELLPPEWEAKAADAAFVPGRDRVACAVSGGGIFLFDSLTGEIKDSFSAETSGSVRLEFSPQGGSLFRLGTDGLAHRVWIHEDEASPWNEVARYRGSILAPSPDGRRLLLEAVEGEIVVVDVVDGERLVPAPVSDDPPGRIAWSPDGRSLLASFRGGDFHVFDAESGAPKRSFAVPGGTPLAVAWASDGRLLAALHRAGFVHVRDLTTGADLLRFAGPGRPAFALFSGDLSVFACEASEGKVRAWDLATGTELAGALTPEETRHGKPFRADFVSGALSPRGELFAGTTWDSLALWDLRTGRELRREIGLWNATHVSFSPDGNLVARINSGQVEVASPWGFDFADAAGGTKSRMEFTAWSPDPGVAACTRAAGGAFLWDPGTGLVTAEMSGEPAMSLAFSPDGRRLTGGHADGSVSLWTLPAVPSVVSARGTLDTLWGDLACRRTAHALRAARSLAARGKSAVIHLRDRLAERPAPSLVARLVRDLESGDDRLREESRAELEWLGVFAERPLRAALAADPSPRGRKLVEDLLDSAGGPYSRSHVNWQRTWALRALEEAGTPAALDALQKTADESPSPREAAAARDAIDRLRRRAAEIR